MDDLIRIRSGDLNGRSEMPRLAHAEVIDGEKRGSEIGFHEGEKALYVGTKEGNLRLCGAGDGVDINSILSEITSIKNEITNIKARLEAVETSSK